MPHLKTNADRLWSTLIETATIGGTSDGGIRRLTLSDEDRHVRDWFRDACVAAGCIVSVDEVGNMFAVRRGRRSDLPPIAIGSHLDTQPTGGKFDGILGVLAGLEIMRTLQDAGYETESPLMLVNWTNEEGARFAPAMLGSAIHAGLFDVVYTNERRDANGITFREALDGIGYRGPLAAGSLPMAAMFELHIEQGPILERQNKQIGIVTGIQGMRWYDVTVSGQSAHAGTTPLDMRRDALLGAARVVIGVEEIARAHAGLATVGDIGVVDASRNVVPGSVHLTVDLRHHSDQALETMEKALEVLLNGIESVGCGITLQRIWEKPVVQFDAGCLTAIEQGVYQAEYSSMPIVSGAGHDSANIATIAPTAMIFIPCRDGLSHNPAESATPEDCAAGAQVLLNAVLFYDEKTDANVWRHREVSRSPGTQTLSRAVLDDADHLRILRTTSRE